MMTISKRGSGFGVLVILVAAAILYLSISCAEAGEATLTWTHPTQYEDNTAIPANTLTATEIRYGICNAGRTGLATTPAPVTVSVPYPAATHVITGLGNGAWCFAARSMIGATSSVWTQYVSKDVVNVPKPPSGLTVGASGGTAFMAIRRPDRFVAVPVGTVPGATPCDPDNGVIAAGEYLFVVPRASVQWSGTSRPDTVVAKCG